jgi:peptide/nickel transport system substrate-binding protein
MFRIFTLFILVCICSHIQCTSTKREPGIVVIRLLDDPDGLNPITTRSVLAVPIMDRIFNSLYHYDPISLELVPILADSLREPELFVAENGDSLYRFSFTILDSARWEDNTAVHITDYLFSLKMNILCELYGSNAPVYTDILKGITWEIFEEKTLHLYLSYDKLSYLETLVTIPVLPQSLYDPESVSNLITLEMLSNPRKLERLYKAESKLQKFTDAFNGIQFSRNMISGSGPYRFSKWESGQFIRLIRKENYWGDIYGDTRKYLIGYPKQLIYKIIPDDAAAVHALNSKSIDVVGDLSPDLFFKMKHDVNTAKEFSFFTPPALQYFYISLNHRTPGLNEQEVRRALAHLINIPQIIESFFYGSAASINGPIHPLKSFYNRDLKTIAYYPELAAQLLKTAGWSDLNSDAILDKVMQSGDTVSLKFNLMTSQRQLGQDLAQLLKQEALDVGIDISIEVVDNTQFITRLKEGNFDLTNMAGRFTPGYDDLYYMWHTQSQGGAGNNFMNYGDNRSDSLIHIVSTSFDKNTKELAYKQFQQKIYDDQVVLFLCAPDERIIAQKNLEIITSPLKPGYCEHLIRVKE